MTQPLNIGLNRSQSDDLMVKTMMATPFIAASWRGGEPIVSGFGQSAWSALNMSRTTNAPTDTEVCSRVVGETLVWRGPSGRIVTIEHMLTIDD
jgi:hypothetical protein